MNEDINQVLIEGNVVNTPEMLNTKQGNKLVAKFRVATQSTYLHHASGKFSQHTEYHHLVAFDSFAKYVKQNLDKGTRVRCKGYLRTQTWKDDNGIKRYLTVIHVKKIEVQESGTELNDW